MKRESTNNVMKEMDPIQFGPCIYASINLIMRKDLIMKTIVSFLYYMDYNAV